jgi:hypothetical protein
MSASRIRIKSNRRRQDRFPAVLPVRVRGTDAAGASFEALAHTLDLTASGTRIGALRQQVQTPATLSIFYRQRRKDFTVVWSRLLAGTSEYQLGLKAVAQEKEPWGLALSSASTRPEAKSVMSGAH